MNNKNKTKLWLGITAVVGALLILTISRGYRIMTFDASVITPTNYNIVNDERRDVFAVEGEYRMGDSWFIPYNRSTGRYANEIERSAKLNNASATREGFYEVQCKISTWGLRVDMFSLYPTIYDVSCYKVDTPIDAFKGL